MSVSPKRQYGTAPNPSVQVGFITPGVIRNRGIVQPIVTAKGNRRRSVRMVPKTLDEVKGRRGGR
jgi:hypothetical protein